MPGLIICLSYCLGQGTLERGQENSACTRATARSHLRLLRSPATWRCHTGGALSTVAFGSNPAQEDLLPAARTALRKGDKDLTSLTALLTSPRPSHRQQRGHPPTPFPSGVLILLSLPALCRPAQHAPSWLSLPQIRGMDVNRSGCLHRSPQIRTNCRGPWLSSANTGKQGCAAACGHGSVSVRMKLTVRGQQRGVKESPGRCQVPAQCPLPLEW